MALEISAANDRALARRELLQTIRIACAQGRDACERGGKLEVERVLEQSETLAGGLLEYMDDEDRLGLPGGDHRARLRRFLVEQQGLVRGVEDRAILRGFIFGLEVARIYLIEQLSDERARAEEDEALARALGFAVLAGPPANAVEADREALGDREAAQ